MPHATHLSCACGAQYERTEVTLPIKDIGIYECHTCGAPLERWCDRTVPVFRYLGMAKKKDVNAA